MRNRRRHGQELQATARVGQRVEAAATPAFWLAKATTAPHLGVVVIALAPSRVPSPLGASDAPARSFRSTRFD
jgi:hypothetical protein